MSGNNISYSKLPTEAYSWRDDTCRTLDELQYELELRREQILEEVEATGMTEELQAEWLELLLERDRVLRLLLKQENEEKLHQHFTTLLQLLVTIGQFDHCATSDALKAALFTLYTELSVNPPKPPNGSAKMKNTSVVNNNTHIPTPPPLPLVLISSATETDSCDGKENHSPTKVSKPQPKRLKLDDSDLDESVPKPRSRRRKTSARSPLVLTTPKYLHRNRAHLGSKYTPRTTRTPRSGYRSDDLRRCILTGKDNLKTTPGLKRSPGGTPERPERSLFSDHPSDVLSMALQKKFFNVRRLYGSPIKDEEEDREDSREASFNLSID